MAWPNKFRNKYDSTYVTYVYNSCLVEDSQDLEQCTQPNTFRTLLLPDTKYASAIGSHPTVFVTHLRIHGIYVCKILCAILKMNQPLL